MPGLYVPFRTSSSTSRPAGAPLPAPAPASSSRHRQVPPPAPPPRSLLPAFHTSAIKVLGAETAQPILPKEVLIPEERVHGRNSSLNYCSSGSLHHHDPSSMCLAAMVHDFLEEEDDDEEQEQKKVSLSVASACGRARCNCIDGVCGAEAGEANGELEDYAASDREVEQLCEILEGYISCMSSRALLKEVGKAMEELMVTEYNGAEKLNGHNALGRALMTRLREAGYNAAACKSRWNHGEGLPAGDYEYIDVIMEGKDGKEQRTIVDINFKAQFEIARPSSEYVQMLNVVPKMYVGRAERIKQIVKMMSQAAKRSLKAQGLMTPPWRRHKYMQAKWLSPIYRRTTNMEPARQAYKNITKEDNMLVSTGAKGYKTLGDSKFDGAAKNLAATAKNQRGIKREESSSTARLKIPRKSGLVDHEGNECTTAMCTSWKLPSIKEKPILKAPLVSALSLALQENFRSN